MEHVCECGHSIDYHSTHGCLAYKGDKLETKCRCQKSPHHFMAALRSRLAEAEGVMEEMNKQLVDATKWTYERHVTALADYKTSAWKNACKDYTAYKSKHTTT